MQAVTCWTVIHFYNAFNMQLTHNDLINEQKQLN